MAIGVEVEVAGLHSVIDGWRRLPERQARGLARPDFIDPASPSLGNWTCRSRSACVSQSRLMTSAPWIGRCHGQTWEYVGPTLPSLGGGAEASSNFDLRPASAAKKKPSTRRCSRRGVRIQVLHGHDPVAHIALQADQYGRGVGPTVPDMFLFETPGKRSLFNVATLRPLGWSSSDWCRWPQECTARPGSEQRILARTGSAPEQPPRACRPRQGQARLRIRRRPPRAG